MNPTAQSSQQPQEQRWWRRRRQPTPEERFIEHLDLIERAARSAGRSAGFSVDDVDDFVSTVKLKLIEDDYAVLRKHRGDSQLSTYLVTVINNLCRDYRNHLWGKYRPSAKAKRLGTTAKVLERLLVRDGLDLETAIQMAKERFEVAESDDQLHQLAAELPVRVKRRFVGEATLEHQPADDTTAPERRVEDAERTVTVEQVEKVLDEALRALDPQDLLILKLHLGDDRSLATIARDLHVEQRPLYTRKDRCFRQLREHFVAQGLTWEEVSEILGWREHELRSVLTDDDAEADRETGRARSSITEGKPPKADP